MRAAVESAATLQGALARVRRAPFPARQFSAIYSEEMIIADLLARLLSSQAARPMGALEFAKLPFARAIEYFRKSGLMTPRRIDGLISGYKKKAARITEDIRIRLHDKVVGGLEEALTKGTTKRSFLQSINGIFDRAGLTRVEPYHLETCYDTVVLGSYAHGQYQQLREPATLELLPYWEYRTAEDSRVRPAHAAMSRRVIAASSSDWNRWFPPNGFRCRCTVTAISASAANQIGISSSVGEPDDGFATHPGAWLKR